MGQRDITQEPLLIDCSMLQLNRPNKTGEGRNREKRGWVQRRSGQLISANVDTQLCVTGGWPVRCRLSSRETAFPNKHQNEML